MCGHMRFDKIRTEVIRGKIRVASIEDKIKETRFRCSSHIRRRSMDAPVRRCERIDLSAHIRSRGRPKKN